MDPDRWAELKAAQTARVEADRLARREASARAVPVTKEEIERYGAARIPPEVAAGLGEIQANIDAAKVGVVRRAEAEAARAAEVDEAGVNEPVSLPAEADAQAALGAVWEPGMGPSDPPGAAGQADAEVDAGLEL